MTDPELGTFDGAMALDELVEQLGGSRERLDALRTRGTLAAGDEAVLVELDATHEELRVASEEIAAQQEQIESLLAAGRNGRRTMHRMVGLLPVAVVTTTREGTVVDANPAAAGLLGVPPAALFGKPLPAYVAQPDRRAMRAALARVAADHRTELTIVLTPRHGPDVRASVAVLEDELPAEPGGPGGNAIHWILATGPAVGGEPRRDRAALHALMQLCLLPLAETEERALFQRFAEVASSALPTARWASIAMSEPEQPSLLVGDSAEALAMQAAEMRAGEGPCFDAYRSGRPSVTGRLSADPRWPRLARAQAGVESVLAVPIRVAGRTAGSLNLFAPEPDVMGTEDDREQAMLFAAAASALVEDAQRLSELRDTAAQLQQAMAHRAPIEQAKGIVMASLHCTPDQAFGHLVALSQQHNVKLRDLAAEIVRANAEGPPGGQGTPRRR